MNTKANFECCPEFDPKPWEMQIIEWDNKRFIMGKVCTFFYMPLNFGYKIRKANKKIEESQANCPQWLCLSEHYSKWKMNIYIAVDKEVAAVENVFLSGKFFCKVYEGNFSNTSKWIENYKIICNEKGFITDNLFMWYNTCPKCARKYGKNYVVILGKLK